MEEVNEAFFGSPETGGNRGRGGENKAQAAIAGEINDNQVGRIRIGIIKDAAQESLQTFIQGSIEPGSTIISDGWRGYFGFEEIGYTHKTEEEDNGMETLQGSYSKDRLAYYFDEFIWKKIK
ncbi:hypothetical protein Holit_02647 [Hollandina sp. SP2]